ncbi:hypothetical protein HanPI659440_Chr03g0097071 [Helianthus annuus]|nr:hypothetical protein HanPI659440_Chr03g0097071 [Helianthus annuus]
MNSGRRSERKMRKMIRNFGRKITEWLESDGTVTDFTRGSDTIKRISSSRISISYHKWFEVERDGEDP